MDRAVLKRVPTDLDVKVADLLVTGGMEKADAAVRALLKRGPSSKGCPGAERRITLHHWDRFSRSRER